MLQRLRRPLVLRLAAPALVLGIALGWAAPARAARAFEAERARAVALLAADDATRVETALREAAARADSPEAFAAEVVRALAARPSGEAVSPAADALLRALYAHIVQAMRLGQGPLAVLTAARPADAPVPHVGPVLFGGGEHARVPLPAAVPNERDAAPVAPLPRTERPQVQPLGP